MRITPAPRDRTTADWKNIGWWSVNERKHPPHPACTVQSVSLLVALMVRRVFSWHTLDYLGESEQQQTFKLHRKQLDRPVCVGPFGRCTHTQTSTHESMKE